MCFSVDQRTYNQFKIYDETWLLPRYSMPIFLSVVFLHRKISSSNPILEFWARVVSRDLNLFVCLIDWLGFRLKIYDMIGLLPYYSIPIFPSVVFLHHKTSSSSPILEFWARVVSQDLKLFVCLIDWLIDG